MESLLDKYAFVIIILKSHERLKKISIKPLVIHCLHTVHLMSKKQT